MISDSGGSAISPSDNTCEDVDLKCVREVADEVVDNRDEAEDGTVMLRLVDEGWDELGWGRAMFREGREEARGSGMSLRDPEWVRDDGPPGFPGSDACNLEPKNRFGDRTVGAGGL
jgi:hypothetical protein